MKKGHIVSLIGLWFFVIIIAWRFGVLEAYAAVAVLCISALFFLNPFYAMIGVVLLLPLEVVLLVSPGSNVTLLKLASFLALAGLLLRALSSREPFRWSPENRPILLYMLAWLVALASGDNPAESWSLTKNLAWFISLFLIGLYGVTSVREGKTLLAFFSIEMILIALFGYYQAVAGEQGIASFIFSPAGELLNGPWTQVIKEQAAEGKPLYWNLGAGGTRIVGTFFSPDYYCAFLGYPISFAMAFFLKEKGRARLIALAVWSLLLGNLILTYSRGGWLAFFVSTLAIIIVARKFLSPAALFLASVPFIIGILAVVDAFPFFGERLLTFLEPLGANPRYDLWMAFLERIRQRPVFGHGYWGSIVTARYPQGVHAHSLYLELLYAVGIAGLFLFLFVVARAMVSAFRERDAPGFLGTYALGYFGALVWFICHNAVDFQFHHPKNGGIFWLTMGVFFALSRRKEAYI